MDGEEESDEEGKEAREAELSSIRNKLKRRPEAATSNSTTSKKAKQGQDFDEDEVIFDRVRIKKNYFLLPPKCFSLWAGGGRGFIYFFLE
jgi:hypothetical protein